MYCMYNILERETRRERRSPMGQIVKRSKKGRPPKADPGGKERRNDLRRSLRRRNVKYVFDLDDYFDEDEVFAGDEEQRRREKKLKHLLKVQDESTPGRTRRVDHATASLASTDDDGNKPCKKRKIDEDMDDYVDDKNDDSNDEDNCNYEVDKEVIERKPEPKTEDSRIRMPVGVPSGLLLPNKKVLELILDKLQKKDIYGVYAEPVDPEELPDYHDVIEHPMDFATVRNKLRNGVYVTFEQFESDVFLICSNAMQYNSPDTIYHKQAHTIQELAKRKFQKIRLNAEHMEETKAEQRMRSGSNLKKQIKRPVSRTVQEPVGSDFSSGATLATVGDVLSQNGTNKTIQAVGSEKPGGNDGLVEENSFLNDNSIDKAEESISGKGSLPRFGRKSSAQDENRRATYSISLSHEEGCRESIFSTFEGEAKQLVPVGLYSDHSYARSLACFAASLGSVAWNVASKRIEQALPHGFKFGRGWVGEYEPLPTPVLILENRNVKEPPYFAKVLLPADSRKSWKIPTFSIPSNGSTGSVSLDQKFPFCGPAGFRPLTVSVNTDQSIRSNILETKAPFIFAPGIRPSGSPNLSVQQQNLQPMTFESNKKVPNQVELNGPPALNPNAASSYGSQRVSEVGASQSMEHSSKNANFSQLGSFKQLDAKGVAFQGMHVEKVNRNIADSNAKTTSSSDLAKQASNYPHHQVRALSGPVQMRTLAEMTQNQQKPSNQSLASAQVLPSIPSSSNESNNAAIAAARAWMSVGAGGFKAGVENRNSTKNRISADSLYNSARDIPSHASQFCPASGNIQPDKISSPIQPFVPQDQIPMMMGNVMPFQHQQMVFPQMLTADLSRLQRQSTWRNLSPQMLSPQFVSRQKHESSRPDLNIDFQSSGSPAKPSSGVLVDSQQPDLALQL